MPDNHYPPSTLSREQSRCLLKAMGVDTATLPSAFDKTGIATGAKMEDGTPISGSAFLGNEENVVAVRAEPNNGTVEPFMQIQVNDKRLLATSMDKDDMAEASVDLTKDNAPIVQKDMSTTSIGNHKVSNTLDQQKSAATLATKARQCLTPNIM
jgi:hypothetical protein